jgi:hypothetical protein
VTAVARSLTLAQVRLPACSPAPSPRTAIAATGRFIDDARVASCARSLTHAQVRTLAFLPATMPGTATVAAGLR